MLNLYDKPFASRLLIGTALYPSPKIMQDAIRASGARSSRCRCGGNPPAARPAMRSGR